MVDEIRKQREDYAKVFGYDAKKMRKTSNAKKSNGCSIALLNGSSENRKAPIGEN